MRNKNAGIDPKTLLSLADFQNQEKKVSKFFFVQKCCAWNGDFLISVHFSVVKMNEKLHNNIP